MRSKSSCVNSGNDVLGRISDGISTDEIKGQMTG
jgi:hypothetical protein